MSNLTRFAAVALAGAALYSAPAMAASDAVGIWDMVADTQMGKLKATMTVAEAGGGYSVTVVDAPMEAGAGGDGPPVGAMESSISEVAVNGADLTFKRSIKGEMAFELHYALKIEGNTLTGKAGSDFGDSPVTGTRKP